MIEVKGKITLELKMWQKPFEKEGFFLTHSSTALFYFNTFSDQYFFSSKHE